MKARPTVQAVIHPIKIAAHPTMQIAMRPTMEVAARPIL